MLSYAFSLFSSPWKCPMVRYKARCVEQIWALYLFNYWSSTKRPRGKEVFFVGQAETEAAIRGAQSHLSSLVSLLDIQLCSPYSLLIRGLIRLSPRMFLSYLSAANFPQAKCSNWAILFHFKLKRGPIMRDFSFIAPTAGTLSLVLSALRGKALWGRTVLTPGMSASICHPWVWAASRGVGAHRSTLVVIDVAYSSVFPCLFSCRSGLLFV